MNNFESPLDFDIVNKMGDVEIVFSDLTEISQGGPKVGSISINGKMIKGRYGGPILIANSYIYAPAHIKRLLGTAFRLSSINAVTLEITYIGKSMNLIWLDKIEDNQIYFFEDINKIHLKCENL